MAGGVSLSAFLDETPRGFPFGFSSWLSRFGSPICCFPFWLSERDNNKKGVPFASDGPTGGQDQRFEQRHQGPDLKNLALRSGVRMR